MWFRNTIRRRAKKTWKHIWLMSTKKFVHICRCYKKMGTFHEFASKFISFKINIIEHEFSDNLNRIGLSTRLFSLTLFSRKYIQLLDSAHCKNMVQKHCMRIHYWFLSCFPVICEKHRKLPFSFQHFLPIFSNVHTT